MKIEIYGKLIPGKEGKTAEVKIDAEGSKVDQLLILEKATAQIKSVLADRAIQGEAMQLGVDILGSDLAQEEE